MAVSALAVSALSDVGLWVSDCVQFCFEIMSVFMKPFAFCFDIMFGVSVFVMRCSCAYLIPDFALIPAFAVCLSYPSVFI